MIIDQSLVGKKSESQTFIVHEDAVRCFMDALGELPREPLCYAPLTFPTTLSIDIPGLNLSQLVEREKKQVFLVAQEYTYLRALKIGESVTCFTSVADVTGPGNSLVFVVLKTVAKDVKQQHVFTSKSTILIRDNS